MNDFDITQSLEDGLSKIIGFLPNLLAALLILLVGYIIGKALARLTRKLLNRARFDRALHKSPAGNTVSRVVESPSAFVGSVVYWLIFIGAISLAVSALNLPVLNDLLSAIYGYIPNVVAAVLIFLVAGVVSAAATAFVQRVMGKTAIAKLVATAIPAVVMSLAIFMILSQLGIAKDIINILFTAIVGSVALGLALAFGLGGREVARDLLEQANDAARSKSDQVKSEFSQAAANTRNEARRAKDNLQ